MLICRAREGVFRKFIEEIEMSIWENNSILFVSRERIMPAQEDIMAEGLKKALGELVIFHGLTDEELAFLEERVELQRVELGGVVCREGDPGSELYLILRGRVEVDKIGDSGLELEINELSTGDSFGEMCLIDVQPRSATIRALEETELAVFRYASLLELSQKNLSLFSKVLLNIAREFSRRLRKMDGRLVEFLQRPAAH